jgi:hypothetical protein
MLNEFVTGLIEDVLGCDDQVVAGIFMGVDQQIEAFFTGANGTNSAAELYQQILQDLLE